MKTIFLVALILVISELATAKNTTSMQGDDCSLNIESITALVNAKSEQLGSYLNLAKDIVARIQIESAVLSNGTMLIATSGGCAHIGQSFTYSTSTLKSDSAAVDSAIMNLESTPTTAYGNGVKGFWLKALKNWKKKPTKSINKVIDLSNADAMLTLRYDIKGLLKVEYSFAL